MAYLLQGTYISSSIEASAGSIFCNNPSGVSSDAWCFAVLPKKCHSFAANQIETGELLASLVACDGSLVYVTLPSFQDKQGTEFTPFNNLATNSSFVNQLNFSAEFFSFFSFFSI